MPLAVFALRVRVACTQNQIKYRTFVSAHAHAAISWVGRSRSLKLALERHRFRRQITKPREYSCAQLPP